MEDLTTHAVSVGHVIAGLQLLLSAILIPSAFMLVRRLSTIRDHLATLNSRTSKMEQWEADHDLRVAAEDRQHEITQQQCRSLHAERMNSLNDRMSELWIKIGDRRQGRRPTD